MIALHWLVFALILSTVKGGASSPWLLGVFVAAAALWSGATLVYGLLDTSDAKLSVRLRHLYPWMHRTLPTLLTLMAIAIVFRLLRQPFLWLDAWVKLLITLGAGTFQDAFRFWRHAALYDNALALITPRFMHRWLR